MRRYAIFLLACLAVISMVSNLCLLKKFESEKDDGQKMKGYLPPPDRRSRQRNGAPKSLPPRLEKSVARSNAGSTHQLSMPASDSLPQPGRCPSFHIGTCTSWYSEKGRFMWNNSCIPPTNASRLISVDRRPYTKPLHHVTSNRTSVVIYGSSHLREFMVALVRIHRLDTLRKKIKGGVTAVGAGLHPPPPACLVDPDPAKAEHFKNTKYGIDLDACGSPGKRVVPELGRGVAIGFKTFVHTPQAEQLFVDFLNDNHLRHPDVLVMDIGIWGGRDNKTGGIISEAMTLDQELDYYFEWLQTTFPRSKKVLVMDGWNYTYYGATEAAMINPRILAFVGKDPQTTLLRKYQIMQRMESNQKCNHGCAGPVMYLTAKLFLEWMEESLAVGCIGASIDNDIE